MPNPVACFCSDPHVGNHGRYAGPLIDGLNRRGRETVDVLRRAVAAAVERGADAFVVCGDLFQSARPEPAVLRAVQGVFSAAREHLRVVLIPGNHDMPDTSCDGGNTAMAPLSDHVTLVTNTPLIVGDVGPGLLAIPFDGREPMSEMLGKILESPTEKRTLVLATHVGVWDEADAAPWMRKAKDGISADALFAGMRSAGLSHAFVGNYHNHRIWGRKDAGGERTIVQVGTLCPASHGDGGTQDRGLLAFLEHDGHVTMRPIPGPRFLTLEPLKNGTWPYVDRNENGWTYYVRAKGGVLEGTAETHGWSALEQEDVPDVEGDPAIAATLVEETDEEAIVATVDAMELGPTVSRNDVEALALACWGKA